MIKWSKNCIGIWMPKPTCLKVKRGEKKSFAVSLLSLGCLTWMLIMIEDSYVCFEGRESIHSIIFNIMWKIKWIKMTSFPILFIHLSSVTTLSWARLKCSRFTICPQNTEYKARKCHSIAGHHTHTYIHIYG